MAADDRLRSRGIRPEDVGACAAIFLEARRRAKPAVPADRFAFEDFTLAITDLDLIVAERAGRIVGFAGYDVSGGEIDLLFVSPEEQGRGVGALLLAEAAGRLGPRAHLRCDAANTSVRAFYRAQGWVERGQSWGQVEFVRPYPLFPFPAVLGLPVSL